MSPFWLSELNAICIIFKRTLPVEYIQVRSNKFYRTESNLIRFYSSLTGCNSKCVEIRSLIKFIPFRNLCVSVFVLVCLERTCNAPSIKECLGVKFNQPNSDSFWLSHVCTNCTQNSTFNYLKHTHIQNNCGLFK